MKYILLDNKIWITENSYLINLKRACSLRDYILKIRRYNIFAEITSDVAFYKCLEWTEATYTKNCQMISGWVDEI